LLSYIRNNATGNNYTREKGEVVEIELTKFPEVFIFNTPELFHSSYNWWDPYLPNTLNF
jgi:hypothetical protein